MLKLTEIKDRIYTLESKIISNKSGNNKDTFELYSLIGLYQSQDGKEDLIKRLKTSGILQHLSTDKAKENYVSNAINYSIASEVYLVLMKHTKNIVRKKYEYILLTDLMCYVRKHAKSILDRYNIKIVILNMHCVSVFINGKHISNYQIHDINELETVYISIAQALTGVKLEDYMISLLHSYLD